jgi:hypothetical protein
MIVIVAMARNLIVFLQLLSSFRLVAATSSDPLHYPVKLQLCYRLAPRISYFFLFAFAIRWRDVKDNFVSSRTNCGGYLCG